MEEVSFFCGNYHEVRTRTGNSFNLTFMQEIDKFKNPTQGTKRTKSLFTEFSASDKTYTLYTLQDEDKAEYPSLYRLYMEMGDLTEYEFATKYFYNWEHWKLLCTLEWFIPHVARWREELDLKTKAEALKRIKEEAKDPKAKNTFSANKILIDRSWENSKPKAPRRAGRPSNEEVQGELKKEVKEAKVLDEDYKRVFGDYGTNSTNTN